MKLLSICNVFYDSTRRIIIFALFNVYYTVYSILTVVCYEYGSVYSCQYLQSVPGTTVHYRLPVQMVPGPVS